MMLLNLNTPDDVRKLMRAADEEAWGGTEDGLHRRKLEFMEVYREEVVAWADRSGNWRADSAALAYIMKMADLCCNLGEAEAENSLLILAMGLSRRIMEKTGDLADFQYFCRVHRLYLSNLWSEDNFQAGRAVCDALLDTARKWYKNNTAWNKKAFLEGYLEELAKAYKEGSLWYDSVWASECLLRERKIRLYLDTLRCREDLKVLQLQLYHTAGYYLNRKLDWDPGRAREQAVRLLNLMKRNPKLPLNPNMTPQAYDLLAESYEAEEEFALAEQREFSQRQRIKSRAKARDYRLKAMDAWLNLIGKHEREKNGVRVADSALRNCYKALAEDFSCLPGEKNARKAEKYRALAGNPE